MVFHRKREVLDPKVVIDDQPIKRMSTVKFLGVSVDEQLSWSDHISNICKKNRKIFLSCLKVKDLLSNYYLHILYCSLILPYMTYACWGNNFACKSQKVVTFQKRAIRLIAKSSHLSNSEPVFKQFRCQKIP